MSVNGILNECHWIMAECLECWMGNRDWAYRSWQNSLLEVWLVIIIIGVLKVSRDYDMELIICDSNWLRVCEQKINNLFQFSNIFLNWSMRMPWSDMFEIEIRIEDANLKKKKCKCEENKIIFIWYDGSWMRVQEPKIR